MRVGLAVALCVLMLGVSGCVTEDSNGYSMVDPDPIGYLPKGAANIQRIDKYYGTFELKTPDGKDRKFMYQGRLNGNASIYSITELRD